MSHFGWSNNSSSNSRPGYVPQFQNSNNNVTQRNTVNNPMPGGWNGSFNSGNTGSTGNSSAQQSVNSNSNDGFSSSINTNMNRNVESLTLPEMNMLQNMLDKELSGLERVRHRNGQDYNIDVNSLENGDQSGKNELNTAIARCEELSSTILNKCDSNRYILQNDHVLSSKLKSQENAAYSAKQSITKIRQVEEERMRQRRIREELFATSASNMSTNMNYNDDKIALLAREQNHLQSSIASITDTISNAANSFQMLQNQHQMFKNIRTKMLDIGTSLGLSSRVQHWIDRQEHVNNQILYGGCFIVLVILYIFYSWWTGSPPAVPDVAPN